MTKGEKKIYDLKNKKKAAEKPMEKPAKNSVKNGGRGKRKNSYVRKYCKVRIK